MLNVILINILTSCLVNKPLKYVIRFKVISGNYFISVVIICNLV